MKSSSVVSFFVFLSLLPTLTPMTDDHAHLNTNSKTTSFSTYHTTSSSHHSLCSIADSVVPPVKFGGLRIADHDLAALPNKKLQSFYKVM
jgi:hypothetical protein